MFLDTVFRDYKLVPRKFYNICTCKIADLSMKVCLLQHVKCIINDTDQLIILNGTFTDHSINGQLIE